MPRAIPKDILDIKIIIDTLKIVWNASKKHTIIRVALVIINAVLPLVPIYLFKLFIDAFSTGQTVVMSNVIWILTGMGIVSLLTIVMGNIAAYNSSIQGDIIIDYMSTILIDKSLDIDLEFFDSDTYHDQFSRAMAQGGTKPLAVLNGVTAFFQSAITLLTILALLFTLHWSIIIILFIISIPSAYIRFIYSEKLVELQKSQTQSGRISGYYKGMLTGSGTAKEVRIFDFGNYIKNKFLDLTRFLRLERRSLYLEQLRWVSFAQSGQVVTVLAALGFISYRAIQGNMTIGDITLYYMAFRMGQSSLSGVMNSVLGLYNQKLTLTYLYEFLGMTKKVLDPINPSPISSSINTLKLENVNFIYPGTHRVVLKDINFEINKGEIVAIVGENGSGKTTLVKLINRLYDTTSGAVSYDGVNVKDLLVKDIRKKITVIFQRFASYALTVKENITLADVFQEDDIDKVKLAAQYATADKFINQLPLEYDTQLGRAFKDGQELSKGQWQKIALARAFYKNGDIIILDEPTSAIDPLAEDAIFQNLKKVSKDKILILITHRMYNLKEVDKILVLNQGELVEFGNHEALMKADGLYKKMFEKQDID